MQKRTNQFLVLMTIFAVVLTSFINPTVAYADDGTNGDGGTSEPAGGDEQPVVVEDAPPVTQAPIVDTVEEIIDQLPEGTQIVVVGEQGLEPLASVEAAEIILQDDPLWCPAGHTPGDAECTSGDISVTNLLTAISLLPEANRTGAGTIYFTSNYSLPDAIFDHNNLALSLITDLTIQGGWNGQTGINFGYSGLTTFSGSSLTITNWVGNVTLNDLTIDAENSQAGLVVQTYGDVSLDTVSSSGNSLGLGANINTCLFDGTQCTGTGDVSVTAGTFDNNTGNGIQVDSGGTVNFNGVQASDNGATGAVIYDHNLQGAGGVQVSNSIFNSNDDHGMYVYAEDAITLTNTDATNNGFDGADLINYAGTGNVTVNGGNFSGNDEAGLYVVSAGNVAITSATANDNRNGAVVFANYGSGNVNVSGSIFNDNTWSGLEVTSNGDITLDDVDASNNYVGGVYLNALGGSGNIFIINNTPADTNQFNGNGQYGIHAFASGNITLENAMVNGGLGTYATENGAWLKSFDGNIFVSESIFTNNTGYGLLAVAAGQVDLVNVTATFNGTDGVEVYSMHSFACFGDDNIAVNVDGGAYTDNGGYGIYAYPGELGSLSPTNNPTFANNGVDDTFVELLSNPCPKETKPDTEDKPSNEIEVPEDGQAGPLEQDCELYSSTTFFLHSGTTVEVNCPFEGNSQVTDTPLSALPDALPVGLTFADAVTVGLDVDGNPLTVLDDGLITLTFKIPEELLGKSLSILYWDPTAKDGQGDWIELPFDQFGGAYFPLYPDNPDDERLLCSGFKQSGDTVTVTVNFPGTFVLVAR